VHDVAIEAGVSRGTVSRFVNGDRYVSAGARESIEAAIEKVGYVPNTAARHLVMQRTETIAFIAHEPHSLFVEDPNIGDILLGANTALSEADQQMAVLIVDTDVAGPKAPTNRSVTRRRQSAPASTRSGE
jgi:DNA-binding LacI/PurR family transcriptional regulator